MTNMWTAFPILAQRGRGLAANGARFLAVAGLALSLSATPAFATFETPAPSNDVSANNDSQNNVENYAAELTTEIVAHDLMVHQDSTADDSNPAGEPLSESLPVGGALEDAA